MQRFALIATLTAASALFAMSGQANAASFRCGSHVSYTEKAICDNAELSRLDSVLARKYFFKLNHRYGVTRARLEQDQIAWLGRRNRCQANVGCLIETYAARIQDVEFQY